MASSSSEETPVPEEGALPVAVGEKVPVDPAASAKGEKKEMRVTMPQSHLDSVLTVEEFLEPLPPLDEEFLRNIAALIPNGEQFVAESGFSLDRYLQLGHMDDVVEAQNDMIAKLQEQRQEKGNVEMEVTDDDEEEEGGVRSPPAGRGRRRFRPGVTKKPGGGGVKKLS